ncbi:MAG TPA: hypothetical protein VII76_00040 [Acidimicrobiales bacterium]
MAAQRSSASKRQRDIDKRSRAAEKRDRRQRKGDPSTEDPSVTGEAEHDATPADSSAILEQMEQLQRDFEAEIIDFETYDARKAELLGHLQI